MANRKPRRPRRQFTPEFKAEIVELRRSGDRSVPEVVKDFDLTETAMRLWVAQAQGQESEPRAQESDLELNERAELAALQWENRRLRDDVEIPKRATAFFAREAR
ncbi:transposase [Streptomyces sp. NBC_00273]|uniref:transposase n=1 Tax=Streptomyces sp. NBC_00273 TaxID=2903644 RepID=UPI002E28CF8B|nr:transposase [Streptomyces sp. NBC_00273]